MGTRAVRRVVGLVHTGAARVGCGERTNATELMYGELEHPAPLRSHRGGGGDRVRRSSDHLGTGRLRVAGGVVPGAGT